MPRPQMRKIAVCATLVLIASLCGCSEQSPQMTQKEAVTAINDLFDEAEELAGGTWDDEDRGDPGDCKKSDGGKGVLFSFFRIGKPTGSYFEAERVADKISALWSTHGFHVTKSLRHDAFTIVARQGENNIAEFAANFRSMSLMGDSECVNGSADEVLDERLPKDVKKLIDDQKKSRNRAHGIH